jgi:hypothetical protein
MKILVTESQYKKILREEEELLLKGQQLEKVLHIPSMKYFNYDWDFLQEFLKFKGYPPYTIGEDLGLVDYSIKSLGNLTSVEGSLDLRNTPIESIGNLTSVEGSLDLAYTSIKSLGNLQSVGGWLDLWNTPIKSLGNLHSVGGWLALKNTPIVSLGNLTSVGGTLDLRYTPLSEKYTEEEIRQMVNVGGSTHL